MISLIVAGHGTLAPELVKAAELIYGPQPHIASVTFVPGENQDNLLEKYNQAIATLDTATGLLFLCDLFGGSPFNAASRLAMGRDNTDVVTGVNLPMLLEIFTARTHHSLQAVVNTATQAGKDGIQALKSLPHPEEEEL
ncbi:PTS mannose transporter subunit IID [Alicyclobacillaceae bacterium I2511]|jgi:PTS system mannose-specific IIA component|nr:PTS mannose transporter subunit IID [Alicyclobacillaceae bacterium I2511]